MDQDEYLVEHWTDKHRRGIIDIFNHYVESSFAAYLEERVTYDFFDNFLAMARGYPALVAQSGVDDIVGFALLRPFHPFPAFKKTAEIGYFIRKDQTRKGLGEMFLRHLMAEGRDLGVDNLLANISSLNDPSLAFHRKNGFRECGRFRDVGKKFGKVFDLVWMQRPI
ncbi:MAG: GNAT family N-acetyltransferase [Smithellaceae bacterium]|nr:GNAT family N-acetyltransferase [Smithellaceae bacterium]